MSIVLDTAQRVFTLNTKNSTYQMKADEHQVLLHTYYGARTDSSDKSYLCYPVDRGFSGNPHPVGKELRTYSLDVLPQEYSCFGTGDYRTTALRVCNGDGSRAAQLTYREYELRPGKYGIPGLPAVYGEEAEARTLAVRLEDKASGLEAELVYGVLEELDVITRAVKLTNRGQKPLVLEKAASLNLDWQYGDFQWITFYGRHAGEQNMQRTGLHHGIQSIGSVRGASSHQYNPFVMLCEPGCGEGSGDCYGFSFLYSGEFLAEVEKDQFCQTRFVCGIHPDNFSWKLEPGESLWLPEVAMAYSGQGTGGVSRIFHRTLREHVCRGVWKNRRRPVLVNNWEATYFDFTADRLVEIAREAADLGIELFVMDDGWFGKRDDDNSGLGDWEANEEKLGCTLAELGERVRKEGLEFGIWLEPEGISEDSRLYRTHPDWAVEIPGRAPCLSRNQLVLDLSRTDVQDYLIREITRILAQSKAVYVKWDMNRSLCDKFSGALAGERQGEFAHRYVLGLYRVLEELGRAFPQVLFEGCSGGGGRFDAGMLYYTPQIWGSDNTDAIGRLPLQYGASFGYPVSATGAHVSAVPNHQTGRVTSLYTRGCVAMAGTFGYELDIAGLSGKEKEEIRRQIAVFKEQYQLIQRGDYYRLLAPGAGSCTAWAMVEGSGREALVTAVYQQVQANGPLVCLKVPGLAAGADYRMELVGADDLDLPQPLPFGFGPGETLTGAALGQCGFILPPAREDYQAWQIRVRSI